VVKLTSTLTTPSCLSTCDSAYPLQESDVKSGYCYIDRHCYADGTSSPHSGSECTKCDAAVNPLEWGPPDTSSACFINGACVASGAFAQIPSGRSYKGDPCNSCDPSIDTTAYSAVPGCELPSTFQAGVYKESGSLIMSLAAMMAVNETNHETIASMRTQSTDLSAELVTVKQRSTILQTNNTMLSSEREALIKEQTTRKAEVESLKTQRAVLQTQNTDLSSQVDAAKKEKTKLQADLDDSNDSISDDLAIALIIAVGVVLLITLIILCVLICKERKGRPAFTPINFVAAGTPCAIGTPAKASEV
jgi:hypothetical protein